MKRIIVNSQSHVSSSQQTRASQQRHTILIHFLNSQSLDAAQHRADVFGPVQCGLRNGDRFVFCFFYSQTTFSKSVLGSSVAEQNMN